MFMLVAAGPTMHSVRHPFIIKEVTIGSSPHNTLVLPPHNVDARHARLVLKDGRFVIVDLKTTTGTTVNRKRITSPLIVREGDVIGIGDFELRIETVATKPVVSNYVEAAEIERQLLDGIAQRDVESYDVYADWLEERGDLERAEFLRLQRVLADGSHPNADAHAKRFLELASAIETPWRARVSLPLVERCTIEELNCPMQWQAMERTAHDGVRFCGSCQKQVHYCVSVEEAKARARMGNCVALDVASLRWPGDLQPSWFEMCDQCERDVGSVTDVPVCPHCGHDRESRNHIVGRLPMRP